MQLSLVVRKPARSRGFDDSVERFRAAIKSSREGTRQECVMDLERGIASIAAQGPRAKTEGKLQRTIHGH